MRQVNPKHIDMLINLANRAPYLEHMSFKVCELGTGYSKVEMDIHEKHFSPLGAVHGGVYATLIDSAAYWAIYCELDENIGYTTLDLSVNYLSMCEKGKIIVEGKSIKIGRNICLAEAFIRDTDGKLIVHGTSKLMLLGDNFSIIKAVAAIGHPPLPPKFIEGDPGS